MEIKSKQKTVHYIPPGTEVFYEVSTGIRKGVVEAVDIQIGSKGSICLYSLEGKRVRLERSKFFLSLEEYTHQLELRFNAKPEEDSEKTG